jgi:hypothetical protein
MKATARDLAGRLAGTYRSRAGRLLMGAAGIAMAAVFGTLAVRHLTHTAWPLTTGNPRVLAGAGLLLLLACGLKAYGWRRLFAASERPQPLALAAANGGASVLGVALPGRFDDAVRVAIVRRYGRCPACVRTLCLSLFMLGLVDAAAMAPLASAAAALPSVSFGLRAGLGLVAAAGVAAAVLILFLPRLARSERALRFRVGRWVGPRTTSPGRAAQAWSLVTLCWLVRVAALLLMLGTLGVGFSLPRALLFLCAGAAAAALPLGPAGAATQAGAGAAVLVASGVSTSQAVTVAVGVQLLAVLSGAAILVAAGVWRTGVRVATAVGTA